MNAQDEVAAKEKWLVERRTAITATDAGAILGVSKYAAPIDVYLDKVGEGHQVVQTDRMEAGNRMQRPIIEWWADRKGVSVFHEPAWTFRKSEREARIGASLDAYVFGKDATATMPVDAKNIGWKSAEWGDADTGRIPLGYAVQLVVQMYVTNAERAFLPVLFSGYDLVPYVLDRDPDLESEIVGRCAEFWTKYVEPRIPPPVDGSESWAKYLQQKFRQTTDVMLDATPELTRAALNLHAARSQIQEYVMSAAAEENRLKEAIGEQRGIQGPGWRVTWSQNKDSEKVDWQGVAADLAALYETAPEEMHAIEEQHTTRKPGTRQFRFTMKGEE